MNYRRFISGPLVLLSLALPAAALAESYGAGIQNSQWALSESVFDCSLSHDIPGYGRAVFRHRAGEPLAFHLESDLRPMRGGMGRLVVEAPAWRPGESPRDMGRIPVEESTRPVSLGESYAWEIARGLKAGMAPTVTQQSRFGNDPVRVRLSNIRFSRAFEDYRQCAAGLLPVNIDQIRRSRVPFASGSTSLSASDRELLNNIATYVLADPTVERVFVDGHTDRLGSRIENRALSEERANVVAEYLRSRGVSDNVMTVRSHGDQYPATGRPADDRRTTIRLQRQGDRPEMQRATNQYGGGEGASG